MKYVLIAVLGILTGVIGGLILVIRRVSEFPNAYSPMGAKNPNGSDQLSHFRPPIGASQRKTR